MFSARWYKTEVLIVKQLKDVRLKCALHLRGVEETALEESE